MGFFLQPEKSRKENFSVNIQNLILEIVIVKFCHFMLILLQK